MCAVRRGTSSKVPRRSRPFDLNRVEPNPEIITRALEIVCPQSSEEPSYRNAVAMAIERCNKADGASFAYNRGKSKLKSLLQKIEEAHRALDELHVVVQEEAFGEDYQNVISEIHEDLCKAAEPILRGVDRFDEEGPSRRGPPGNELKQHAALYAYMQLSLYSAKKPTLSIDGPFFRLASIIYEGATRDADCDLQRQCRVIFHLFRTVSKQWAKVGDGIKG